MSLTYYCAMPVFVLFFPRVPRVVLRRADTPLDVATLASIEVSYNSSAHIVYRAWTGAPVTHV